MPNDQIRGFGRLLYTQNPFYLLSALLVLYGLRLSFGHGQGSAFDTWSLALALCGYTLLMALTAIVLIRFGRVWDDARSIVLILLLMFLAISVSFDELCRTDHDTASRVLVLGLCFSVLVSEIVIRSIQIRFSLFYRIPLHALLALFFLYPLWVSDASATPLTISWRIMLFPTFAGVLALMLIPAIHQGRNYSADADIPWKWPYCPWSAFVFLGVGVLLRSYVISLSFDPVPELALSSEFGIYYLVPFVIAVLVLLVEIGTVENHRGVVDCSICAAPLILLMSIAAGTSNSGSSTHLLDELTSLLGSPTWLIVLGLVAFYGYVYLRGHRRAEGWCCAALVLATFTSQHKLGWSPLNSSLLNSSQWWPLAAVGVLQLVRAIRRRNSVHCFVAIVCFIGSATIALWPLARTSNVVIAASHAVLLAAIGAGIAFPDRYARYLRGAAAAMTVCFVIGAAMFSNTLGVPGLPVLGYLATTSVAAFGCWRIWKERWWIVSCACSVLSITGGGAKTFGYAVYLAVGPEGFYPLVVGSLLFMVGGLISAHKCGLLMQAWRKIVAVTEPATVANPKA